MEDRMFDGLAQKVATEVTRRGTLRALSAAAIGAMAARFGVAVGSAQEAESCNAPGAPCGGRKGRCCCGSSCNGSRGARRCECRPGRKECQGRCIRKHRCCTNQDCGNDAQCQQGKCSCQGGTKLCDDKCIPEAKCCADNDCPIQGQICRPNHTCACPTGQKACNDSCISKAKCCEDGDCDSQGQICRPNHTCACPATKQTICGDKCTDTDSDDNNCGSCGNKCVDGGVCDAGSCSVVVTPTKLKGWRFYNDNDDEPIAEDFVTGPDSPPSGSGSARLRP